MAPMRRKGFSAKQSRRMSRNMESSQIGTHYARHASRPARASSRGYSTRVQRTSIAKRVAVIALIIAALAAIAFFVGSTVFFGAASSRLSLGSDEVRAQLVASEEGEPYFALLAADLDGSDDGEGFSADALVVARVDAGAHALTLASLPSNAQASLSDGEVHPLSDAVKVGGDAELISTVASLLDIDIAHYARTDEAGIVELVTALGGVSITLSEEVDDPRAGIHYLPAGSQTLDGEQAITLLSATNFTLGAETQSANQCAFLAAAAEQLLSANGPALLTLLDELAGDVKCDVDANGVISLASPLSGIQASSVVTCRVPGYVSGVGEDSTFSVSSSAWEDMLAVIEGGSDPTDDSAKIDAVDPGSFEITVRNGSGVTGAAAEITDLLAADGFNVVETGNADSYVYTETLVVYADDANEARAEAVVSALGVGRAIPSSGFYTFETDILVVIGSDFTPLV